MNALVKIFVSVALAASCAGICCFSAPGDIQYLIDREYENAETFRAETEDLLSRHVEPSDWEAYYEERRRVEEDARREKARNGGYMLTNYTRFTPLDPWLPRKPSRHAGNSDLKISWRSEHLSALETFSKVELVIALCEELKKDETNEYAEMLAQLWASIIEDVLSSGAPEQRDYEFFQLCQKPGTWQERTAAEKQAHSEAFFYRLRSKTLFDAFFYPFYSGVTCNTLWFDVERLMSSVVEKHYAGDARQFFAWLKKSRILEWHRRKPGAEHMLRAIIQRDDNPRFTAEVIELFRAENDAAAKETRGE